MGKKGRGAKTTCLKRELGKVKRGKLRKGFIEADRQKTPEEGE